MGLPVGSEPYIVDPPGIVVDGVLGVSGSVVGLGGVIGITGELVLGVVVVDE